MSELFTEAQLAELTDKINRQLQAVQQAGTAVHRGRSDKKAALARQRQTIAEQTREDPDSFLHRFVRKAKQDLCEPGGILFEQWRRMKDLSSKKMLKTFGSVLAGMGLTAMPLQTVLVAVSVYVLHIGVETLCEEAGDAPEK